MANNVDIIIKAVDRASGEINKVSGSGNKLSAAFKSLTGFSLGAGAAMAAVGAGVKFMQQAVDETVNYATEIDNLSRLLGISTEDTSRLVQASDDLFISQEKLASGLQAATRQGIDVSIEGLKRLSEQYLAMPEGVARSEFVLKTFGRSGAEMGKLMEVGAEGIDKATSAIADNMVVTQQTMEDIMDYKRSVDNLNDAWQGVKYTIGTAVIPALTDLLTYINEASSGTMEFSQATANWLNKLFEGTALESDFAKAARNAKEQQEGFNLMLKDSRNAGIIFDASIGSSITSLYGLSDIIPPVTSYFSDLTTEMLFSQAAAGLDAEASMALAESMGLIDGETKIVLDALGMLRSDLDTGKISLDEYNDRVATLNERMALIQSKTVTITVRTSYEDQGGLWGQGGNAYIGLPESNRATGGLGGGWTRVGEMGPEMVKLPPGSQVYSNTRSNQMSGGYEIDYDRMARANARAFSEELQKAGR